VGNSRPSRPSTLPHNEKPVQPAASAVNEVHMMGRIQHPNITHLVEWFQDENAVYLVLRLCHGNVKLRYPQGVRSLQRTCRFHFELTSAIRHLHNLLVLHGDIRPEHLLLTSINEDSAIQLGDFRVAQQLDSEDQVVQVIMGTMSFAAPECLTDGEQCLSSDIWSSACTLFWMLLGHAPFEVASDLKLRPAPLAGFEEEWEQQLCELAQQICSSEAVKARRKRRVKKNEEEMIELMRGMFNKIPDCRMTVDEVEFHPWTIAANATTVSKKEKKDSKPSKAS